MHIKLTASKEELKKKFHQLDTLDDLADILGVPKSKLYYYAYKANLNNHYKKFDIPKKSGGRRTIYAPSSPLKIVQTKISQLLEAVYFVKAPVHGFVHDRSILTNAERHLEKGRKKFIFNADIKNFFPTITMERVENLLKAFPYNLPPFVAQTIARLTCFMSFLPQGAPSSPIISNMICAKMDTRLRRLAQSNKCVYTRYADDITISTDLLVFPGNIASYDPNNGLTVAGMEFQAAIEENGFKLNEKKLRLQSKYKKQEITGLVVNTFPNVPRRFVRQIRAMLFAWEKFGYESAEKEYNEKYSKSIGRKASSFKKVIRGKLEFLRMVKGDTDAIYLKLRNKFAELDPEFAATLPTVNTSNNVLFDFRVLTEGKSDWKHLKAALKKFQANDEYTDLSIKFVEHDEEGGDKRLLNHCKLASIPDLMEICIFDRDKADTVKQVMDEHGYRKWRSKVYSFALPIPSHRIETPEVCIELYYKDSDITKADKSGRRLFLNNEFHVNSGKHKIKPTEINSTELNKIRGKLTVIDNAVYDSENINIALSKNDFAVFILDSIPPFDNMDFSEFRLVFDLIRMIIKENSSYL